ncbi:MAG: Hsp20/alpha crystallin family protein [Anaerolineales bacterium]
MTLYIQPYPYRHMARRLANWERNVACEQSLRVNVHDEEDAFVLKALVPGLKAEDLTIQVLEDVVHIEGAFPGTSEEQEFLLNELPNGAFHRTLRMPAAIQADKVEARISEGVLTLRLPKAESARPKKIKVSVK